MLQYISGDDYWGHILLLSPLIIPFCACSSVHCCTSVWWCPEHIVVLCYNAQVWLENLVSSWKEDILSCSERPRWASNCQKHRRYSHLKLDYFGQNLQCIDILDQYFDQYLLLLLPCQLRVPLETTMGNMPRDCDLFVGQASTGIRKLEHWEPV